MDSKQAQALKLLNEALATPKGDVVVTVESEDRDLLRELWTLQGEGVEITEVLQKAGNDPGTVYLVLKDIGLAIGDTALALGLIKQVLDLVKAQTKNKKKNTKTNRETI